MGETTISTGVWTINSMVVRHCNVTCHFRDLLCVFEDLCTLIRSSINFSEGAFDKRRVSMFFLVLIYSRLKYLILELDLCDDVPSFFSELLNWFNTNTNASSIVQICPSYIQMSQTRPFSKRQAATNFPGCSSVCSPGSKASNGRGPLLDKYFLRVCS